MLLVVRLMEDAFVARFWFIGCSAISESSSDVCAMWVKIDVIGRPLGLSEEVFDGDDI